MRRRNETTILLVMVTILGGAFLLGAGAGEPLNKGGASKDYARAMGQGSSIITVISSANSQPLEAAPGAGRASYAWGSVAVINPSSPATCCWSMDPDLTLGAQNAETATSLGSSTRGCLGYSFAANEPHDMVPELQSMQQNGVGYTGTYCSGAVTGVHGERVFPACLDGTDCSTIGAGTCTRSDHTYGAVYLICRPSSDNTIFRSNPER